MIFGPLVLVISGTLFQLAQSHFVFDRIAVNHVWQAPTRFFRNKTYPFDEAFTPNTNVNTRNFLDPTYNTDDPESVRCGRGTMNHAADTEVLLVDAGDTIEIAWQRYEPFEWNDRMWYNCSEGRGSCDPDGWPSEPNRADFMDLNHPGPFMAHLSMAPQGENISSYDGSGEWTKIYTLGFVLRNPGVDSSIRWLAWNDQINLPGRFLFNIPEQTPAGQYLLRLDEVNMGIAGIPDTTQFYPSCVQLLIKSDYSGSLPSGISIPEDLSDASPGIAVTLNMYRGLFIDPGYLYPGGELWNGTDLIVDKPDVRLFDSLGSQLRNSIYT